MSLWFNAFMEKSLKNAYVDIRDKFVELVLYANKAAMLTKNANDMQKMPECMI